MNVKDFSKGGDIKEMVEKHLNKTSVSAVASNDGVMPLFDKHNANLVWLIGHLSFLNVTQKTLNDDDYNKAFKMLEVLRIDLYENKA